MRKWVLLNKLHILHLHQRVMVPRSWTEDRQAMANGLLDLGLEIRVLFKDPRRFQSLSRSVHWVSECEWNWILQQKELYPIQSEHAVWWPCHRLSLPEKRLSCVSAKESDCGPFLWTRAELQDSGRNLMGRPSVDWKSCAWQFLIHWKTASLLFLLTLVGSLFRALYTDHNVFFLGRLGKLDLFWRKGRIWHRDNPVLCWCLQFFQFFHLHILHWHEFLLSQFGQHKHHPGVFLALDTERWTKPLWRRQLLSVRAFIAATLEDDSVRARRLFIALSRHLGLGCTSCRSQVCQTEAAIRKGYQRAGQDFGERLPLTPKKLRSHVHNACEAWDPYMFVQIFDLLLRQVRFESHLCTVFRPILMNLALLDFNLK